MFLQTIKNKKSLKTTDYGLRTSQGFTLVETIIAVAVLLFSITGPLTIATRSLTSAVFAKDQVTAFYLAQEATEFIRNKRDNNALLGNPLWLDGLSECIGQSCIIDATEDIDSANAFVSCGASCGKIKKSSSGLYGHDNLWTDTRFTREIIITSVSSTEIGIDVTISWESGPIQKSFTIRESILNWQ